MAEDAVRIAMWSGPRSISTAMLRSWGSRADTFVCDEPLYAHYLKVTGVDHPGRDEVIASCETDWRPVVAWLTGPVPGGRRVFYQKHMAHHLLPGMDEDWIDRLTNCFLIRDPGAMLVSLGRVLHGAPTLDQTGLTQQWRLFTRLADEAGEAPPVIDGADVLRDPTGVLSRLCARLGVGWDAEMLRWAPGPRPTDGVWARHWYSSVAASTGFAPHEEKPVEIPPALAEVHEACCEYYRRLAVHRIA